ncbi:MULTISPECIES: fimbrial protein [Delftia]|uniref:fimbrial protein n=1 Tax=Delftia TaxID=80865 RepID=UPI0018D93828|nr:MULTISPECIES: fimbrial protein [Delftia]MBK0113118.1 type 1 fimbrial protein [Delftia sp. S65]MBK0117797.1 type 1 fimbrial protein [Delftia sp. S67]MBK0129204.1 type 1 fimbrial protein [Delftia sp. S66]QPR35725.1 type 1 fimbrial protein [Delftia acidovorans]
MQTILNRHIQMKFSALKLLIAALSIGAFGSAHAQRVLEGRINFTGNITPATCEIDSTTRNIPVDFGAVPPDRTGFAGVAGTAVAVNDVATNDYTKTFTIRLLGCTPGTTTGHPNTGQFKFAAGPGYNTQRAGNLSTTNSSVDIQILESGSAINLNNPSSLFALTDTTVTVTYGARYRVAETLKTGIANSAATFTLVYP